MKRHSFSRIQAPSFPYPDFLDIQVKSFLDFFQVNLDGITNKQQGLYEVFQEYFPISDTRDNFTLEFIDYSIDPPQYEIEECLQRGLTHSVPLKARLRLNSLGEDDEVQCVEQEVFLGNIPYMTPRGSFVINGAERVIVSQLHRSPGVFFSQNKHTGGARLYSARVIPIKGSWIEFATDVHNVMYAYIDRRKKFPVTMLLRAIGYGTDKEILDLFGICEEVKVTKRGINKVLGRKLAARVLRTWTEDFVDESSGEVISIDRNEVILERDSILKEEDLEKILEIGTSSLILQKQNINVSDYVIIYNTLQKDNSNSEKEALEQIYRQLRNIEAPDESTARETVQSLFFSEKRYDLGKVGRHRINRKLGINIDPKMRVLTPDGIVKILSYLLEIINSKVPVDDIDHLSNRRIRTVGELLSMQFGLGLSRMARIIRDRMNVRDNEEFKPIDLINVKTLASVINSFFGTNQLSQFMDQTNPLAELTHKRRISALGPGGLSRERAGFEVRDVHFTHYGRLCTIETPEGPNIGLISSLCVYAKVNDMGFIETPYRTIKEGTLTEEALYLTAEEEDGYIARANAPIDKNGGFINPEVKTRRLSDFPIVSAKEVTHMDISTNQIVSVAAALIPCLEHDDANRALMGSNMQRQAVPLLNPEAPTVGTGMEALVAQEGRNLVRAERDGEVVYVDAKEIRVRCNMNKMEKLISFDQEVITYRLTKFRRTNQDTCMNLRPLVYQGQMVKQGDILCEGFGTDGGELALGANLRVAFMPWRGYNFEDAILISERVVREDVFTSIHIEEFEMEVRDLKRGVEEFTSEIPNIAEHSVRHLGEDGIISVGAPVREGDILVGKITPKGEADPTPEEKLLRVIFGDKAGDVRDASLTAPMSMSGVVIGAQKFQRRRSTRELRAVAKKDTERIKGKYQKDLAALRQDMILRLTKCLDGQISDGVRHKFGDVLIKKGIHFTQAVLEEKLFPTNNPYGEEGLSWDEKTVIDGVQQDNWTSDAKVNQWIKDLLSNYRILKFRLGTDFKRKRFSIEVGDELPNGVLQMVKVHVAKKRKLKVGDKMAGRHGNKGVVARIVRQEDMPFLEDGTPVDIVLNPLGVPSRMNIGQIYETVLGWAGLELGKRYATPIFDGATEADVEAELAKASLPVMGRARVFDGLTGEPFDQKVTVGVIYMMKLGHLVDDKVHARSIGPYSLITQQPLGGRSQFGGQRFGEMEVWALEAFGAAHILREMLTVKSDDVVGRSKVYESIVKGENMPEPNIPESFNVLVHELRGLALSITFS